MRPGAPWCALVRPGAPPEAAAAPSIPAMLAPRLPRPAAPVEAGCGALLRRPRGGAYSALPAPLALRTAGRRAPRA